jgi:uncharacterized protein
METMVGGQSLVQLQVPASKRYKPSRFNAHTRTPEGTLVLYNSYTGHRCGLQGALAESAAPYLSQKGFTGQLDRLGEYLLAQGYILLEETDEDAKWDVRYGMQQFRTDLMQLILLSSEDCNFRCVYCSQQFKRGSMQPQVRTGVKALVQSVLKRITALNISWFGGEPLLGYDAIEELAPFFQETAKAHDIGYQSGMTTNAYLLTPERSRKLVEWGCWGYQITLDGTATDHDAHRPLKEGGATFATIISNIAAMKQYDAPLNVNIRVNFDNRNVAKLQPLFDVLSEKVGGDSRFAMLFRPVGKWGGPNDDQLDICGVREAGDWIKKLTEQARATGMSSEALGKTWLDAHDGVCYAARPYNYIIGADGKVMKCTVVLDTMPQNVVGHISEDGRLNLREELLAKWIQPYYKTDTMCQKCFYVPVCQGASCPLPRIEKGSRPCPEQKVTIGESLKFAWKEKIEASKKVA